MIEVLYSAVHPEAISRALRHIHRDWSERPADIVPWLWAHKWFPHLSWDPEIIGLLGQLPADLTAGTLCDPQIVVQWPHTGSEEPQISYHTDQEPEWAEGRRYARIIGVPLSPWLPNNGSLRTPEGGPIACFPGDAIHMSPDQPHSPGVNFSGLPRYGVYFRWLA